MYVFPSDATITGQLNSLGVQAEFDRPKSWSKFAIESSKIFEICHQVNCLPGVQAKKSWSKFHHWVQCILLSSQLSYKCTTVAWSQGIYWLVGCTKCSRTESGLKPPATARLVCVLLHWMQFQMILNEN